MRIIEKIYPNLPIAFQNIACTLYGSIENKNRFNQSFQDLLAQYIPSDFSSAEQIKIKKSANLARILISATNSQFYSKFIKNYDTLAIKNNPFEVLEEIPILTKEELIEKMDIISKRENTYLTAKTSGTTGKSLILPKDRLSIAAQWAIWLRHRHRFGIRLYDKSVNFTGKPVVPISQKCPPYWRFNKAQNQYLINMQHINKKNIKEIVSFLNSIKPKFYSGYPSIISELSRLALDNNLTLNSLSKPSIIFTGAEKLLDTQKKYIEQWTKTKVTDQYGLTEGNCNFSKCEYGNYHEDYEFCHIETLCSESLPDGSKRGKLVGTAFYNEATPLIRYDTGDIATIMPDTYQCPCGRSSRVIALVDGRIDDYVITPDGKRIMRFDYLFKDTNDIFEAQVIQEKLGEVIILTVPRSNINQENYEKIIHSQFHKYISKDMRIYFSYTEKIPRTTNGKFKAVVNRLEGTSTNPPSLAS